MKLPYHNPLQQTVPDAMHTIKDVVENLFGLISGRRDNEKVREAERKLGRFTLLDTILSHQSPTQTRVCSLYVFLYVFLHISTTNQSACACTRRRSTWNHMIGSRFVTPCIFLHSSCPLISQGISLRGFLGGKTEKDIERHCSSFWT